MSKYDSLWRVIAEKDAAEIIISFDEIHAITGVGVDHSFLTYKKALLRYGYEVKKNLLRERRYALFPSNNTPPPFFAYRKNSLSFS